MRDEAQRTAAYFTWEAAMENLVSKLENQARIQKALVKRASIPCPELKEAFELKLPKVGGRFN